VLRTRRDLARRTFGMAELVAEGIGRRVLQ